MRSFQFRSLIGGRLLQAGDVAVQTLRGDHPLAGLTEQLLFLTAQDAHPHHLCVGKL